MTATAPARPLPAAVPPAVVVICGCLIAILTFGPRSTMGFFLTPMTTANGWSREAFALAIAIQNLMWGLGQPFAGMIADRWGTWRVLTGGAALYALGLVLMAYTSDPTTLSFTGGVLVGLGIAGCAFFLVLAAFARLLPASFRGTAYGLGTAAGSMDNSCSPRSVSVSSTASAIRTRCLSSRRCWSSFRCSPSP